MADAPLASRPTHPRARTQQGFGLIELLMATVVIAFVMIGFALIFGSAARESTNSANRTGAQELATSEMDKVRALTYAQIGTVGGNPPGVLPAVKNVGDFTVVTKVTYVNDPAPGGYATNRDYKAVKITVIVSQTGKTVAVQETKVTPPGAPSLDKGVIKVTVVDETTNQPIPDATVHVNDGPGAPISITDTTSATGEATFPNLEPNDTPARAYAITVSAPGYTTEALDLPPMPNASVHVAAASVLPVVIRMFKPLALQFKLVTNVGTPIVRSAQVYAAPIDLSTFGVQSVTGGTYQGNTIGTMQLKPNTDYSFSASFVGDLGFTWVARTVTFHTPANASNASALIVPDLVFTAYSPANMARITVTVVRGSTPVSGALVRVAGGPGDLTLEGQTNGTGQAAFDVPAAGGGYSVSVTDPAGGMNAAITRSSGAGSTTQLTITVP